MTREIVCKNCGIETTTADREETNYTTPCELHGQSHDWSEPEPVFRAKARMESSSFAMEVEEEWSDDWDVLTVKLTDHDFVGASEAAADAVRAEGFSFVGIGEGTNVVRFNRSRADD